jgi:hypothetical protein
MTTEHERDYFRALLERAASEDRALTVSGAQDDGGACAARVRGPGAPPPEAPSQPGSPRDRSHPSHGQSANARNTA